MGEPEPVFVVGVVLVAEGQSQQKYRLCANLMEPNSHIKPSSQPLPDCGATRDELQGCKYKTALDVKAGFFTVKIRWVGNLGCIVCVLAYGLWLLSSPLSLPRANE